MKKITILSGVLTVLILTAFVNKNLHTDVYQVDIKKSSLDWYAEKVTGKHNGTIEFSSGDIKNNHGSLTGTFEFDMKSLANKDIDPGEKRTKLETHLKSADFFDVEKFPKSKFILTSVTPIKDAKEGGFTHTAKGLLTIKDKTNEISFDVVIKMQDNNAFCNGSAIVDRSKFDIRYGSKTFFADIGDKMINDEFTLKFNVVAVK